MPFGLKNAGATFQWAMSFTFHDLKNIVEAYLDDLASCSRKRTDHPTHLRLIFECCHYFRIRLNPNKCNFYVTSERFLGFIVSTTRIMVDPLKVEAIIQLPPPHAQSYNFRVYKARRTSYDASSPTMPKSPRALCVY
jgi:hypothetical protein